MDHSKLKEVARAKIRTSAGTGDLFLNPMSAWEIGVLVSKNRLSLSAPVSNWFDRVIINPAFTLAELSVSVLIESTQLPGSPPNDPVDRMMLAMAREYDYEIMTRDAKIIAYAEAGYARVIEC